MMSIKLNDGTYIWATVSKPYNGSVETLVGSSSFIINGGANSSRNSTALTGCGHHHNLNSSDTKEIVSKIVELCSN